MPTSYKNSKLRNTFKGTQKDEIKKNTRFDSLKPDERKEVNPFLEKKSKKVERKSPKNRSYTKNIFREIKEKPKEKIPTLTEENYPSLNNKKIVKKENTLNFANVVKDKENKPVKKNENTVAPGWVVLSKDKNTNKVIINYGAETENMKKLKIMNMKRDADKCKKLFEQMLKKWQEYRDIDIEFLGDRSEFYGLPSLLDAEAWIEDEEEEEYSDGSESEEYEYIEDY
jgi:hypothetical protein